MDRGRRKLTQGDLVERVAKYMGSDYEVVGQYQGSKIPVDVLHKTCGNIGQIYISHLKNHKSWCVFCKAREKYKKQFLEKLKDKKKITTFLYNCLVLRKIIVIGKFISYIRFIH